MGAGKSTVGSALADLLGCAFLDLDAAIERAQGERISEIFKVVGEGRFRELETSALRHVLEEGHGPAVIALGGGTFTRPANVELLKASGVHVVFLEAPVEELFERCQQGAPPGDSLRPLASTFDSFATLYMQRLPQYRSAELTVVTLHKTAKEVAREIAFALRLVASG